MAILQYIAGNQILGAYKYNFYYEKNDGSYEKITSREVIQDFQHRGVVVNGKVKEESFKLKRLSQIENQHVNLYPIRMLTNVGVKVGVKVYGMVSVIFKDGVRNYKVFETTHYVDGDSNDLVTAFMPPASTQQIVKDEDGWYLIVNINGAINRAKVMDASEDIMSVGFYPDYDDLEIYGAAMANEYEHTDYIYINCLTDDYQFPGTSDLSCIGTFDLSEDLGYSKMSFYNKNLVFIADAKVQYLVKKYNYTYYTKEEIITIARDVCGVEDTTDENYPRFVVFCSKKAGNANKDKVCVGNLYFPLFDMPSVNQVLKNEETNTLELTVTADSRKDYYTESDKPATVTYTAPQEQS